MSKDNVYYADFSGREDKSNSSSGGKVAGFTLSNNISLFQTPDNQLEIGTPIDEHMVSIIHYTKESLPRVEAYPQYTPLTSLPNALKSTQVKDSSIASFLERRLKDDSLVLLETLANLNLDEERKYLVHQKFPENEYFTLYHLKSIDNGHIRGGIENLVEYRSQDEIIERATLLMKEHEYSLTKSLIDTSRRWEKSFVRESQIPQYLITNNRTTLLDILSPAVNY